jgi:hypothetical protein
MRYVALRALLLALLSSALFAGAAEAKRAPVGDVAQGAGVVSEGGDTFAFDARSGVNGENPTGTMSYFASGLNATIRGDVTCMRVNGNRALVAGIITESPIELPATGAVGETMYFFTEDGGRRGPDLFASAFGGFEDPCGIDTLQEPNPIASGHIEITDCTALTRNGKRCAKVRRGRTAAR